VCVPSPLLFAAPAPTFSAPLAHRPLTHTLPHNTDDAFGLEFGDLLVDTDHSHSLMEVTAMVRADACRRGVWEREGGEVYV